MAIDTYSTARLLGAYGVIDRPKSFLYDTYSNPYSSTN